MQTVWKIKNKKGNFNDLGLKYGISPVLAKLLINRNVKEEDFSDYLSDSYTPVDINTVLKLKDIEKAADILRKKISEGKKIRVVGDYDVDGVCSTYILVNIIRDAGGIVDFKIPHRFIDGYGINVNIVNKAIEDGVDTIITCDNGIKSMEQAKVAKAAGLTYIVTDHHEISFEMVGDEKKYIIPSCDAVVDQKLADSEYPYREICGTVIAYRLAQVLYGVNNTDISVPSRESILQFKAREDEYTIIQMIATIADVMPVYGENRKLIKKGLSLIKTTDNLGLRALIKEQSLNIDTINSYNVGFGIAPCLNAAGRLKSADLGFGLLDAKEPETAQILALKLCDLNNQRKGMTEEAYKKGVEICDSSDDAILVVYIPSVHEGVIGIVASKLVERYNKPIYAITDSENGYKGSGRSVKGYNMIEDMTLHGEYFSKYGGHEMAAGFSFNTMEDINNFREAVNKDTNMPKEPVKEILADMQLPFNHVTVSLCHDIDRMEPYGEGNESPLFMQKDITLKSLRFIGKDFSSVSMELCDDTGYTLRAVMFKRADEIKSEILRIYGEDRLNLSLRGRESGIKLAAAFELSVNDFRGNESAQLMIREVKFVE